MYCIYKFLNEHDELLYIGKSINIPSRMNAHFSEKGWKKEDIKTVLYAECNSKTDMDLYEIFYINKLKPKYNISLVNEDAPSFELPDIKFKPYFHEEKNTYSTKKIGKQKTYGTTIEILNIENIKSFHKDIFKYILNKESVSKITYLEVLNYLHLDFTKENVDKLIHSLKELFQLKIQLNIDSGVEVLEIMSSLKSTYIENILSPIKSSSDFFSINFRDYLQPEIIDFILNNTPIDIDLFVSKITDEM